MLSWLKEAFGKAVVKAMTVGIVAVAAALYLFAREPLRRAVQWMLGVLGSPLPVWVTLAAVLLVVVMAAALITRLQQAAVATSGHPLPIYTSRVQPLSADAEMLLSAIVNVTNQGDDCWQVWLRENIGLSPVRHDEGVTELLRGEFVTASGSDFDHAASYHLTSRGRQWAIAHGLV